MEFSHRLFSLHKSYISCPRTPLVNKNHSASLNLTKYVIVELIVKALVINSSAVSNLFPFVFS